jgi:CRP-like cAMP-binding protein
MALVEHKPRNATVVADTPMRLLAFDTKHFKTLLEEMPKAHDRVMETLAARLRARNA